jgi:hypothetical protein
MSRKKPLSGPTATPERSTSSFHDPEGAARSLCRAAVMLNDVHGTGNDAALLAPLIAQLAGIARSRGVDVVEMLQRALREQDAVELPAGAAPGDSDALNDRLLAASSQACAEIVQLASIEMNRSVSTPALFKAMAAAGVVEELAATPRDPEQCLTAGLPRDAVLTLMYTLAAQRQRCELRVADLPGADARDRLFDDLWQLGNALREAGCSTDADYDIGLGLAIWTPPAQQVESGAQGLCLTYGRGAVDPDSPDFMVRFDPRVEGAAEAAAGVLYRAHLSERANPERELIHVDGALLRQHPLQAGEVAELCAAIGIDPVVFVGTALQFTTLVVSEVATLRLLRAGFMPVGLITPEHAAPASSTRH